MELGLGQEFAPSVTLVPIGWLMALVLGPVSAIAVVVSLLRVWGMNWGFVLADPAAQYDFPAFAGFFSHAGVLALAAAAAVCLFARSLLVRKENVAESTVAVLGLVALLTILLALDDLFLLHERFLRHQLGLHEKTIYAAYGLLGLGILWKLEPDVLRLRFLALWVAIGFLGFMAVVDQAEKVLGTPALLLLAEETAKLCGFVLWTGFWVAYARAALMSD